MLRHNRDEPSLVGQIKRVESEDFARSRNIFAYRHRQLVDADADIRGLGDLDQTAAQAAARQVTQAVNFHSGLQQSSHRLPKRSAVRLDRGLERQPLARRHDRDAVAADVSAQQHDVPDAH